MNQSSPPGFPSNITVSQQDYENWSQEINVSNVWTCTPESVDEIVQVCNWAKDNNYRVRPRGIAHGWSPLTVTNQTIQTPDEKVILVDMTQSPYLSSMELIPASGAQCARVKVGMGATMLNLLGFLEGSPGGQGSAPGYSFPHTPAPGHLTVGGALAIGAHGSAIPSPAEANFKGSYGSLSNQIVEFTAVVFDSTSGEYAAVAFKRGQGDDKAFLTHVGRAFLLDATLQVIDNYNLRCQSTMLHNWETLFKAPTGAQPIPPDSLAHFLGQSGRVEIIWFPFSSNPWLKVWTNTPSQPTDETVVVVTEPNNYAFSDNIPDFATDLFKLILGVPTTTSTSKLILEILEWILQQATKLKGDDTPEATQLAASLHDISGHLTKQLTMSITGHLSHSALTPLVGKLMAWMSFFGLYLGKPNLTDLWGASKNTLLYVADTTLRVTANGYAIHLRRADVQQAVSDFGNQFNSMLLEYQAKGEYPINAPLEIRVTGLDDPSKVSADPGMTAQSPVISALGMDNTDIENNWDTAVWFDVLTLPQTPSSYAFYAELEAWLVQRFSGTAGKILPEWSKGWAYTAENGAWTNTDYIQSVRQTLTTGRSADDNWDWEVATLKNYDPHNLFSNSFLDQLMTPA